MNMNQAIETLREESTKDPVMDAVLHMFATRKRTRSNLAVSVLDRKMKREKFTFQKSQYEAVIKRLSELGLGTLVKDHRGTIRGIKDVKVTFNSLAEAVYGKGMVLKALRRRNRYVKVSPVAHQQPLIPHVVEDLAAKQVRLVFLVGGQEVTIPIPDASTPEEIGYLIKCMKAA